MSNNAPSPSNPAPQIQNLLNSLRAARAERQIRRANPRQQHTNHTPSSSARTSTNEVIASTDTDAASSRLSAVRAGWLTDAFADRFCPDGNVSIRKMPIINRGTYVRTKAVDALVHDFLTTEGNTSETSRELAKCQVLSLGAGTDTRWPRIVAGDLDEDKPINAIGRVNWVEVDFPETMERKTRLLQSIPQMHSSGWKGVGMDLRELVDGANGVAKLKRALDSSLPTLILSEMCLSYLQPEDSSRILERIAKDVLPRDTPLRVVMYEPLQPGDAFGKTMVKNLSTRGIVLPGFHAFETLDAHGSRLVGGSVGFAGWQGLTVGQWWSTRISAAEKDRLRAVEMVDEEEEWMLLAGHYGLIWAWRGTAS